MSRFLVEKYKTLDPYVPGEQPKDKKYIKLNTNECPYPPSKICAADAKFEALDCYLYSDPDAAALTAALAEAYGLEPNQVLVTNGSDEALDFAFRTFCSEESGLVFPDITYGFYPVLAKANGIPFQEIPLQEGFFLDYKDYLGIHKNIVFANPNAPTGMAISREEVEEIVKSNPDHIVIVDEAYVDFGGESAVPLIDSYDNLLVCMTFSKSRSLAGARVGFIMGNADLIADMNRLKYATNPYNVNRMSQAMALAAIKDPTYFRNNCLSIQYERKMTEDELTKRGFLVLPSKANFLFAEHSKVSGEELYRKLKEKGILVRHFSRPEIADWIRITIGTQIEMKLLLKALDEIFEEMRKKK